MWQNWASMYSWNLSRLRQEKLSSLLWITCRCQWMKIWRQLYFGLHAPTCIASYSISMPIASMPNSKDVIPVSKTDGSSCISRCIWGCTEPDCCLDLDILAGVQCVMHVHDRHDCWYTHFKISHFSCLWAPVVQPAQYCILLPAKPG